MAVLDGAERQWAALKVANDNEGYRANAAARAALAAADVSGGRRERRARLAQRLIADGETVLDVPPKVLDPGPDLRHRSRPEGRPDRRPHHRRRGLADRRTAPGPTRRDAVELKLMTDRRRELVRTRTRTVIRLQQPLLELIPAGASRDLTAGRTKTLLATVRPRDVAGRTRRHLAGDLIDDVAALDRRIQDIDSGWLRLSRRLIRA